MPLSNIYNQDCLEAMRQFPDNHFSLAIVDPPYGIGESGNRNNAAVGTKRKYNPFAGGDKEPPAAEYFKELFRVSKNQIIWGGNYFTPHLPASMGWIFWDKDNHGDYSDGELAFTSFKCGLKKVLYVWNGFRQGKAINQLGCKGGNFAQGNKDNLEMRIHPTQKPVALYKWLLANFAKPGDTILDTHLGSGSSRIAAYDMGFDFTGYELDAEYFAASDKRFREFAAQTVLF